MKIKEWLKTLLTGIAIGISSAIPGVSGGTIAVILKIYEKLMWAIANIFKAFKKAIVILIPVLIGFVIGLIPTIILMDKALDGFLFGTICIFAGFIIGSLPQVTNEVKNVKIKKSHIITLVITFGIAVTLGVLSIVSNADVSSLFTAPSWWVYLVMLPVGALASIALAVPGISGGMLLILVGFYKPIINSINSILRGECPNIGAQIGLLVCLAVGIIVGFFLASKLMNYLLDKHHDVTFFGIIGFIGGSLISLFINNDIWSYYQNWSNNGQGYLIKEIEIPLGIALLIVVAIGALFITRYAQKQKAKN